jgi:hypothetical protein
MDMLAGHETFSPVDRPNGNRLLLDFLQLAERLRPFRRQSP